MKARGKKRPPKTEYIWRYCPTCKCDQWAYFEANYLCLVCGHATTSGQTTSRPDETSRPSLARGQDAVARFVQLHYG